MMPSIKPFIIRSALILIGSCIVVVGVYAYIQSLFMEDQEESKTTNQPIVENAP